MKSSYHYYVSWCRSLCEKLVLVLLVDLSHTHEGAFHAVLKQMATCFAGSDMEFVSRTPHVVIVLHRKKLDM